VLPVARSSCDHRTALATLTENAFAASRQLAPSRIALTTRSRRSQDRARVIRRWPPPSQQLESEITPRRNPKSGSIKKNHALGGAVGAQSPPRVLRDQRLRRDGTAEAQAVRRRHHARDVRPDERERRTWPAGREARRWDRSTWWAGPLSVRAPRRRRCACRRCWVSPPARSSRPKPATPATRSTRCSPAARSAGRRWLRQPAQFRLQLVSAGRGKAPAAGMVPTAS